MKLRALLLTSALALCATPAFAGSNPGWYLGLGVGYDQLESVRSRTNTTPATFADASYSGSALFAGSVGYKFESGMRIEFELGYDSHDISTLRLVGGPSFGKPAVSGGTTTTSGLINFVYDWNIGDRWGLSLGGGVGQGDVTHDETLNGSSLIRGAHTQFAWQGIAGVNYEVEDDLDLFLDYRYRSNELDHDYSGGGTPDFVHIFQQHENVALLGVRWFIGHAAPPPPPPPPPPVKTFIVFFDFEKSNLTDKAVEVVQEAVRTAKQNGFVKVLVTGHTDTVGSDSYNQALSVRRAESVKDEMIRQGMDGSGISIEGKSFHDPLVPTGPGVREPQNRRAVIDLGG